MNINTLLARLLDYPEQPLLDHLDEARDAVRNEPSLSGPQRNELLSTIDTLAGRPLLELQADYVQTFDTVPEQTLYLTHHTFGDSRERGPALVELGEHYKQAGLVLRPGELPDYLPLMLEYAATLEPSAAAAFLAAAAPIVATLAATLERTGSTYAPLLRLVAARGRRTADAA